MADNDIELCPNNRLSILAALKSPDTKAHLIPLTDEESEVIGFISEMGTDDTEPADDATAIDPSLSVSGSHVGRGDWMIDFPKTDLDFTLLDSHFGESADPVKTPVLIIDWPDGRVWTPLTYVTSRRATVVE